MAGVAGRVALVTGGSRGIGRVSDISVFRSFTSSQINGSVEE